MVNRFFRHLKFFAPLEALFLPLNWHFRSLLPPFLLSLKTQPVVVPPVFRKPLHKLPKIFSLTNALFCVIFFKVKGKDEDTALDGLLRDGSAWWEDPAPLLSLHTTSEPQVGNGLPGTPVTVSMSGGLVRNQGGTVEYANTVSHPWFLSGVGFFYTLPPKTRR